MSEEPRFYDEITPKIYKISSNAKTKGAAQPSKRRSPSSESVPQSEEQLFADPGRSQRKGKKKYLLLTVFLFLPLIVAGLLVSKVSFTKHPNEAVLINLDALSISAGDSYYMFPGRHNASFSATGYYTQTFPFEVTLAGDNEFTFELEKKPGHLTIAVTPSVDASVSLDGVMKGKAPLTIRDIPAGEYTIKVQAEGYQPASSDIVIMGLDKTQDFAVELIKEIPARLSVTSLPGGAAVNINNQFVGLTPVVHQMKAGQEHQLVVVKPGYQPVKQTVKLKPQEQKTLELVLQPNKHSKTAQLASQPAPKQPAPQPAPQQPVPQPTPQQPAPQQPASQPTPQQPASLPAPKSRKTIESKLGLEFVAFEPKNKEVTYSRGHLSYTTILSRAFAISKTEITNKQFRAFASSHSSGNFQGTSLDGENQPAVNVSWTEAALFSNWLSEQAGVSPFYMVEDGKITGFRTESEGYRLASEAEWMNAAQRIPQYRYWWGNDFERVGEKSGNYADKSAAKILMTTLESYNDAYPASADVGRFHANGYGIYDLEGNAAEWLHDVFTSSPYEETLDPLGPLKGRHHIIRGGSWKYASRRMLSTSYRQYNADEGKPEVGFRIAYYIKPK